MSQHSPLPWTFAVYHGTDDDVRLMQSHGIAPVQALSNDGQRYLMSGEGDSCKRVALIDCQTAFKRGQGFKQECAERDANAALIVRAVNAHEELVAALRMAVDALECEVTDAPMGRKAALLAQAWFRAKFGDAARAALAKAGAK